MSENSSWMRSAADKHVDDDISVRTETLSARAPNTKEDAMSRIDETQIYDEAVNSMRLSDLPACARKAWLEGLKVGADNVDPDDDSDEDLSADLLAHWRVLRRAVYVSQDGCEIRTTDRQRWFADNAVPYRVPGDASEIATADDIDNGLEVTWDGYEHADVIRDDAAWWVRDTRLKSKARRLGETKQEAAEALWLHGFWKA